MFVNILFAIIVIIIRIIIIIAGCLRIMYAFGFHTYRCLNLILHDRIIFGLSVSLLFMVMQPGLYWLYSNNEVYIKIVLHEATRTAERQREREREREIKIVKHKLFIGAYQWYWKRNGHDIINTSNNLFCSKNHVRLETPGLPSSSSAWVLQTQSNGGVTQGNLFL